MVRLIPLIGLCFVFCQNYSNRINILEHTVSYGQDGTISSKVQTIGEQTENSWRRSILNPQGSPIETSHGRTDGKIATVYVGGKLHSVISKDDLTGCEIVREYDSDAFTEFTTCSGREVHVVRLQKGETSEKKCNFENGLDVCRIFSNGAIETTEYEYHDGQSQINFNDRSSIFAGKMHYFMWLTRDIPDGKQREAYKLELPIGSPLPTAYDARWQLWHTETMKGYLSAVDAYALSRTTDGKTIVETRIELY